MQTTGAARGTRAAVEGMMEAELLEARMIEERSMAGGRVESVAKGIVKRLREPVERQAEANWAMEMADGQAWRG